MAPPSHRLSSRGTILIEIGRERKRQIEKHGAHYEPNEVMLRVLGEEYGEVCEAMGRARRGNLRDELIQVAAVCVKWVEGLDARG